MARTGKSIIKRKITSRYTIHLKLADSILNNICSVELHEADMAVWVKEKYLRHVLELLESDGKIIWPDKSNEVIRATINGHRFNSMNGYYGEIKRSLLERLIRWTTLVLGWAAGLSGAAFGLVKLIQYFFSTSGC